MSKPIQVVALADALPDHVATVTRVLAELAQLSRQEEGCLRYDVFQDSEHRTRFNTIELWADQPSMDAHLSSTHLQRAISALIGKMAGLPQIRVLHPVNVGD